MLIYKSVQVYKFWTTCMIHSLLLDEKLNAEQEILIFDSWQSPNKSYTSFTAVQI